MAGTGILGRVLGGARGVIDRLSWVVPLATRVVIGLAFIQTGIGKWQHFDNTVQFFASVGIPFARANAAFVATLEVAGGTALVIGLLTRLAAFGLSTTMVVALLTADRQAFLSSWSPASESGPTDVTSFVFLLFLAWLIVGGPGAASVDRALRRVWARIVPGPWSRETDRAARA